MQINIININRFSFINLFKFISCKHIAETRTENQHSMNGCSNRARFEHIRVLSRHTPLQNSVTSSLPINCVAGRTERHFIVKN